MKLVRLAYGFAILLLLATPVQARDKAPDVAAALTEWKEAVESTNLDHIMGLYDRNAMMISSFAQNPLTKRSQIEGYFKKVLANPDIKVEIEDQHPRLFGDMA